MIKELMEVLEGVKMTVISGIFLGISFILMLCGIETPIDPALVTIVISGTPIAYSAIRKLFGCGCISSSLLITIAIIAAVVIGEVFAAGEVAFIMAIGEILEDITVDHAKQGLHRLLELRPTEGRKIFNDGTEKKIPLTEMIAGDILRILPGETVPTDGIIIKGSTSVNQAMLTGESLPVDKTVGDTVMAGTVNCFGVLDIRVTTVQDTYLQKMINLVKEANEKKAPTQRIVDKWAAFLVPAALILGLATYLFTGDVIRGVTVLVVFCPCALVLATPTAIMAAIGHATKRGVLIKSGAALEEMGKVDTIAFDKTGTLTVGNIQVSHILSISKEFPKMKLLALVAGIEKFSEHTLAQAIVRLAERKKVTPYRVDKFQMIAGKGVCGKFDEKQVAAGNRNFIQELEVEISKEAEKQIQTIEKNGEALIIVAYDNQVIGVLGLADEIRSNAASVIEKLKQLSINTVILTGDHRTTAKKIAAKLKIAEFIANLLPDGKVKQINLLRSEKHTVCMVGDGVNDAAALKTANVGIAMGKVGSDIAVEAADIALINDNIDSLPYLKKLALLTNNLIKVNITISMTLNFLGIILSMYGILTPATGAIVHNLGSVLVVLNASSLWKRKIAY